MGLESRDWYREDSRRSQHGRLRRAWAGAVVGGACAVALVLLVGPTVRARLPFGLERLAASATPGDLAIGGWRAGATYRVARRPLYPPNDPWRPWLADEATCPGGEDARAASARQVKTLLCLVNFARRRDGLRRVSLSPMLSTAAVMKAQDIDRCGKFEHAACGKAADQTARDVGYRGSWGENLYIAEGRFVVPRVAVDRWLNSRGHRRNLFDAAWRTIGIARRPDVDVERVRGGVLWVNAFGG